MKIYKKKFDTTTSGYYKYIKIILIKYKKNNVYINKDVSLAIQDIIYIERTVHIYTVIHQVQP